MIWLFVITYLWAGITIFAKFRADRISQRDWYQHAFWEKLFIFTVCLIAWPLEGFTILN